jgi:hypothetical protein
MNETKEFYPIKGVTVIGTAGGPAGGSARLTICKEIMDHLGMKPGDHLSSHVDAQGRIVFERLVLR